MEPTPPGWMGDSSAAQHSSTLLSTPAVIFGCTFADELYRLSGSPGGWPAMAAVGAALLLRSSVALWIVADAQEDGRAVPYDMGSFVFFLPLVGLIYLFLRRGWEAFIPLGWYIVLILAATFCAWLPNIVAFIMTGQVAHI
jgi:hypothetical protein